MIDEEKEESWVTKKWKYIDEKYIKNVFGGHLENSAAYELEKDTSKLQIGESRELNRLSFESNEQYSSREIDDQSSIELVHLKSSDDKN